MERQGQEDLFRRIREETGRLLTWDVSHSIRTSTLDAQLAQVRRDVGTKRGQVREARARVESDKPDLENLAARRESVELSVLQKSALVSCYDMEFRDREVPRVAAQEAAVEALEGRQQRLEEDRDRLAAELALLQSSGDKALARLAAQEEGARLESEARAEHFRTSELPELELQARATEAEVTAKQDQVKELEAAREVKSVVLKGMSEELFEAKARLRTVKLDQDGIRARAAHEEANLSEAKARLDQAVAKLDDLRRRALPEALERMRSGMEHFLAESEALDGLHEDLDGFRALKTDVGTLRDLDEARKLQDEAAGLETLVRAADGLAAAVARQVEVLQAVGDLKACNRDLEAAAQSDEARRADLEAAAVRLERVLMDEEKQAEDFRRREQALEAEVSGLEARAEQEAVRAAMEERERLDNGEAETRNLAVAVDGAEARLSELRAAVEANRAQLDCKLMTLTTMTHDDDKGGQADDDQDDDRRHDREEEPEAIDTASTAAKEDTLVKVVFVPDPQDDEDGPRTRDRGKTAPYFPDNNNNNNNDDDDDEEDDLFAGTSSSNSSEGSTSGEPAGGRQGRRRTLMVTPSTVRKGDHSDNSGKGSKAVAGGQGLLAGKESSSAAKARSRDSSAGDDVIDSIADLDSIGSKSVRARRFLAKK